MFRERIIDTALAELGKIQPPYSAPQVCGAFVRRVYEAVGLPVEGEWGKRPGASMARVLPVTTEPQKGDLVRYPSNGHCGILVSLVQGIVTVVEGTMPPPGYRLLQGNVCNVVLSVRLQRQEVFYSVAHLIDRAEWTGACEACPVELGID